MIYITSFISFKSNLLPSLAPSSDLTLHSTIPTRPLISWCRHLPYVPTSTSRPSQNPATRPELQPKLTDPVFRRLRLTVHYLRTIRQLSRVTDHLCFQRMNILSPIIHSCTVLRYPHQILFIKRHLLFIWLPRVVSTIPLSR